MTPDGSVELNGKLHIYFIAIFNSILIAYLISVWIQPQRSLTEFNKHESVMTNDFSRSMMSRPYLDTAHSHAI